MPGFLIVNFGGPRNLAEVPTFLETLLTDEDVIWTSLPSFLQRLLFRKIARKRAKRVAHDYQKIGGKSPIFEDTENIAAQVASLLTKPVLTFHRYLPETHEAFIEKIEKLEEEKIIVFPLFPQFSFATTGSIARWMYENLKKEINDKLHWVKSYCDHPLFIECERQIIEDFLRENGLEESKTLLLFSMHGLPQCFVCLGDPYRNECERSYRAIANAFPLCKSAYAFQSKFGKAKWLAPSTEEMCHRVSAKNVVLVPLGFTSDHVETLFEIEEQYLPILRKRGINAYRCPALNQARSWILAIAKLMREEPLFKGGSLIRSAHKRGLCQKHCKDRKQRDGCQIKSGSCSPACHLEQP